MPIEYVQSGQVSTKTDTYAYGVVMLELLTAKPPVAPGTRQLLVDEVDDALMEPATFVHHLDPRAGSWAVIGDKITKIVQITARCVESKPNRRCTVAEVVGEIDALAGRSSGRARSSYS